MTTGLIDTSKVRSRIGYTRLAHRAINAGVVEINAAVMALMPPLLTNYFPRQTIVLRFSVLVIITGFVQIFGGFRISSAYSSQFA
ncbi:MAG: hypothetical protein JSV42_08490 [Chloroflexota bacterium]|nr:MAG: hypothetical protein JSV42_08490 [Chloroflexota bacterium]